MTKFYSYENCAGFYYKKFYWSHADQQLNINIILPSSFLEAKSVKSVKPESSDSNAGGREDEAEDEERRELGRELGRKLGRELRRELERALGRELGRKEGKGWFFFKQLIKIAHSL